VKEGWRREKKKIKDKRKKIKENYREDAKKWFNRKGKEGKRKGKDVLVRWEKGREEGRSGERMLKRRKDEGRKMPVAEALEAPEKERK
jgi:hypothetical protein